MKLRFAIAGVMMVALAVGITQRAEITRLQGVVEKARGAAEEVRQLKAVAEESMQVEVDTNQLEQLRGEHLELMRLRSEMPELRAAARTPEAIKQEIVELREIAAEARERAELILDRRNAHELSKATESFVATAGYLIDQVAEKTGKRPSSWAELRQSLEASGKGIHVKWESMDEPHNFAGVTFRNFEFLPAGSKMILREKVARAAKDGGWGKFYLLEEPGQSRLQTKEVVLPDGAFEQWERGQMLAHSNETGK